MHIIAVHLASADRFHKQAERGFKAEAFDGLLKAKEYLAPHIVR